MKKEIKFAIIFILAVFYVQAFSQLSGYYTVGETGSDYETLQAALSDLHSQGVNDNVTFALSSGTYSGFTLHEISGAYFDKRLTIQSATLDSSDVEFTGTVRFDKTSYCTLKAVSITTSHSRAIDFSNSFEVVLDSCNINSSYVESYDAPVYLLHSSSGGWSRISIYNCIINSVSTSIFCKGSKSRTNVRNCIINSKEDLAVEAIYSNNMSFIDNILNGGIDVVTGGESHLIGNTITGKINVGGQDSVINNVFISDETVKISSNIFKNNHFPAQRLTNSNPGQNSYSKFINNLFEGEVDISRGKDIKMVGNTFLDDIDISFNEKLHFENNLVFGVLSYGDVSHSSRHFLITNNIFSGGFILAVGHYSDICYNNFIDSAYLYVEYTDLKVHDNNFCRGIEGKTSPENISHNNYYPLIYCYYDTNSMHYDPMYSENSLGIATNPLLQGKGITTPPEKDYLGNIRKYPAAIGANEVYICSDSNNNVVTVPCGEELYLNTCKNIDTTSFWWSPDSCLLYPDSLYTSVKVCNDMTLYLNSEQNGVIDSIKIISESYQVEIAPIPLFYCGYARTLNASYHPNAHYRWSPEIGLTNPNIRNPKLLIEDTTIMQYVLECVVEGCGTSYDTLQIEFDGFPHAVIYYPSQNYDSVFFLCTATCTDEFLWEFGDGTFSTEQNPYHIYTENNRYEITLTVTNSYGSNTYVFHYDYYFSSSNDKLQINRIEIYPNPASTVIHIDGLLESSNTKISVYNLSSKPVITLTTKAEKTKIDISKLKSGIYIIEILFDNQIIRKKIVVI